MSLVEDSQIQSSSLSNPLPLFFHFYVWPFVFVWPAFSAIYLSQESYDKYIGGSEWTFVWLASIITVQGLIWLSTFWSVEVAIAFTSLKTKTVEQAKEIKLIPVENAGKAEICKLERDDVGGKKNVSFVFQRRRFIYSSSTSRFAPLTYALDAEPKPSIASFQNSRGLISEKKLKETQDHYGDNTFDIPVPTFTELFKEHAVAPFFIFQLFCVGLWLLDDYWYYSLFTLFMLVVFESTVVWQRQRTMTEFRGMGIKPYAIWVHRSKGWEEIQSDKLLPGDLVSLGRTKEDSGVACDMLLVEGTAILNEAMLSGESTPVLKDSVQLRQADALIEPDGIDKNAFVWGGTKVLQITHGQAQEDDTRKTLVSGVKPPPDNGAMAIIVKTGFETSQGSLVRTMMFSTERVSANNAEALLFILFLLVFAIAASWYVWTEGVIKNRKRSKLLLDCILIITSVVPPELPMELSLAVNTSLAALSKLAIFCTEPFRIPFAGRVDIACFDKTGTLTGEDLVVEGIAGLEVTRNGSADHAPVPSPRLVPVSSIPDQTTLVLATAHALVKLEDGDVVGEPMEKATLSSLKWKLGDKDTLTSKSSQGASVQIKRRFQFSSALKRQSSVANITVKHPKTGKPARSTFVGVKGAPETIQKMLVKTPSNYEDTFKYFSRNGSRVLALAYKHLSTEGEIGQNRINNLKREEVESELNFAGFLVLTCPLKEDAAKAVRMLNESSHRTIMITGDNPLTAVYVARQVEIIDREALILDAPEDENTDEELVWRSVDDKINIPCDPRDELDEQVLKKYDLCVTGVGLAKFKDQKAWNQLLKTTYVYARVSPKQKEDILIGLRNLGYTTLMCGDGTNDVGALKQAHIGVALLNGSQDTLNRIAESWKIARMKGVYEKQVSMMRRFNQPTPPVPIQIAHVYPPGPSNPHYEKAVQREAEKMIAQGKIPEKLADQDTNGTIETITSPEAQALQQGQKEEEEDKNLTPGQRSTKNAQKKAATMADQISQMMMTEGLDDDEPPTLKLGDASAAAPFTSKLANVVAIPNIIRQGRCTLVATIQMYKILALNCLISAYSLSVLYLDGIKFGDGQVTISGMLMSVCFLSISRAKPVEALSKERAHPNIFNPYIILSVLGQFAIHIVTLIYIKRFVATLEPPVISFDPDAETEFEPSLLNSAVYLLQLIQQISTFAVNYQGRPFRESISENKGMYYGILMVTGVAFSCATEFVPEINEKLRLVKFIMPFKIRLTATMLIDFVGCWAIEKTTKYLFGDFRPKDIAKRRPDQIEAEEKRKEIEKKEAEKKAVEAEARRVDELVKAGG